MMGVEWADCPMVAEMVGIKFFTNEFVAYQRLSQYKSKRLSGVEEWIGGEKQWISVSDSSEERKSFVGRQKVSHKFVSHPWIPFQGPRPNPQSKHNSILSSSPLRSVCYSSPTL